MKLPQQAIPVMDRLYKNAAHMEMTIGILRGCDKEIVHFGPDRTENKDLICYPVGSICKTFTTALMAKFISEGKLSLDAPLSDYISGLPEQYYPTLKRLATHSSGYGGRPFGLAQTLWMLLNMNREKGLLHVNPFRGTVDEARMRKVLAETKLEDRDYKFEYSNLGYGILGHILGITAGSTFWDAMTDYVENDLELKNTFLGNVPLTGYDKKGNPCQCWQWEKSDLIAPAGALNSNASDMLDYAAIQMNNTRPYLNLCHQVHGDGEKSFRSGLAWRLEKDSGISWHTGSAGAFSAWLGLDHKTGNAVFVGMNYGLVDVEGLGFSILKNL